MKQLRTHYDNLKVSRDAPPEVIRMAYKALVAKYHPDRNPDSAESLRTMQAINDSYEVLMDDEKRRRHDQWIADQERTMLEGARMLELERARGEVDKPHRKSDRPARSGCGCLWMASSLCIVLFVVFAVASILTTPPPSSASPQIAPSRPAAAADKSAASAPSTFVPAAPPAANPARVVNVYWDGKQHPVRADRAVAIRKKVDVASWYISEYLKLRDEKTELEKRLKSSVFSKGQIRQKIADLDEEMNELDASGMKVIGEVEADIKASAP